MELSALRTVHGDGGCVIRRLHFERLRGSVPEDGEWHPLKDPDALPTPRQWSTLNPARLHPRRRARRSPRTDARRRRGRNRRNEGGGA
jgi:hypothetical protein